MAKQRSMLYNAGLVGLVLAGSATLYKRMKTGSWSIPMGNAITDSFWDYGPSWTNMKLSPGFELHEKPIAPHRAGADLAKGPNGGVISDPYYNIEYEKPGYDYYRTGIYPSPPSMMQTTELAGDFAGPKSDMFSSMITDSKDKVVNFMKGFDGVR